jgi:ABC-type glycerol-3-phosphate transport system substrate-binding protein
MNRYRLTAFTLVVLMVFVGSQFLFASGGKEEEKAKELTLLTWNIPSYEPSIRGWIEDFEQANPGATVVWKDRKGSEWATYFQTQVASGSTPDVFEIQSQLWVKYAADGLLLDLGPYLNENPELRDSYVQSMLNDELVYDGTHYMVPFFMAPTVLWYNRNMMDEVGLGGPPQSMRELADYARRLSYDATHSGFLTLNFDWHYWPLLRANGVRLLNDAGTKAAFNTQAAVETLEELAELTQSGAIAKMSWTGRWKEPNDAFASGTVGMYLANGAAYGSFKSVAKEDWVTPENVGVTAFPGGWAVPNYHALGISKTTADPDLAWNLVEIISSDEWAEDRMRVLKVLSGNAKVNEQLMQDAEFRAQDELRTQMYEVELANMDKLCGNPLVAEVERIKEVFYSNFQKAIFGEVSAREALSTAEARVNEILAQ